MKREYNDTGIINLISAIIYQAVSEATWESRGSITRENQWLLRDRAREFIASDDFDMLTLGTGEYIRKEIAKNGKKAIKGNFTRS